MIIRNWRYHEGSCFRLIYEQICILTVDSSEVGTTGVGAIHEEVWLDVGVVEAVGSRSDIIVEINSHTDRCVQAILLAFFSRIRDGRRYRISTSVSRGWKLQKLSRTFPWSNIENINWFNSSMSTWIYLKHNNGSGNHEKCVKSYEIWWSIYLTAVKDSRLLKDSRGCGFSNSWGRCCGYEGGGEVIALLLTMDAAIIRNGNSCEQNLLHLWHNIVYEMGTINSDVSTIKILRLLQLLILSNHK